MSAPLMYEKMKPLRDDLVCLKDKGLLRAKPEIQTQKLMVHNPSFPTETTHMA